MPKFFLTHAQKDIEFAKRLYNDLTANGLEVWFDAQTLQGGQRLAYEINRALEWCDVYIPIISRASLDSPWCQEEIYAALSLSVSPKRQGRPRIIPLLVEDCASEMPPSLQSRLYINFSGRYENAIKELLKQGLRLPIKRQAIPQRVLRVFLCHSSNDKPVVRNLYRKLKSDGVDPWLDSEKLLPGQDWDYEILKAVRASEVVIVCLSANAVKKVGYIQKEIKYALDVADEQPEGTIFLIPLRLDKCNVPDRLQRWQWVDFFDDAGYGLLMRALRARAATLKISL